MTSGVTRSGPSTNGEAVAADVGVYVSLADLIIEANEGGCECNVCEALRAANVTAISNQAPLQARYRRLTSLLIAAVALLVLLTVIGVLDIFFNIT